MLWPTFRTLYCMRYVRRVSTGYCSTLTILGVIHNYFLQLPRKGWERKLDFLVVRRNAAGWPSGLERLWLWDKLVFWPLELPHWDSYLTNFFLLVPCEKLFKTSHWPSTLFYTICITARCLYIYIYTLFPIWICYVALRQYNMKNGWILPFKTKESN